MEQNPQEIVKLVKGQPDWHLTVNDNYDVIKQKIDDATGEVKREEFEALETEVADLGSNIVDMGAIIADQNTTINGQTALIQGVDARIAVAEPKITTAQTTATNAGTAAATAQTTANTANTAAATANNFNTNLNKMYNMYFNVTTNALTNIGTGVNVTTNTVSDSGLSRYIQFNVSSANPYVEISGASMSFLLRRMGNVCFANMTGYGNVVKFKTSQGAMDGVELFRISISAEQFKYFDAQQTTNYDQFRRIMLGLVTIYIESSYISVRVNGAYVPSYTYPHTFDAGSSSTTKSFLPRNIITGFNGATPIFTAVPSVNIQ